MKTVYWRTSLLLFKQNNNSRLEKNGLMCIFNAVLASKAYADMRKIILIFGDDGPLDEIGPGAPPALHIITLRPCAAASPTPPPPAEAPPLGSTRLLLSGR